MLLLHQTMIMGSMKHMKIWDKYEEKNNLGETTKENAIQTLKSLDLNSQIEALAIVWHILIADGLMKTEEKALMVNLLEEFNFDVSTISNKLQEMLS